MLKQAVILAGGKGTRPASRLNVLPEPLVPIGGIPLLERLLLYCKSSGIRSVLLSVNHKAEYIAAFCALNGSFGLRLNIVDDVEARGTAGAVLAALPHLDPAAEDILILYGDTLLNADLERFHDVHARSGADATLFLHPDDHPHDLDLVELDEQGFIAAFHPYPHPDNAEYPNLVNAGLYIIRRETMEARRGLADGPPRILDFAKEFFPDLLGRRKRLYGYVSPEYIKDIGTPERLDQAEADIASGRFERGTLRLPQRAVFLDRDGVLNEEAGFISDPDQLRLLPGSAAAVRRLNRVGLPVVVVTNQPVVARGECTENGLKAVHTRLENLLGREGAYLDRIYYCPHHPDKGFPGERPELKIACDCRKPAAGMLRRAAEDMNIDLARSILVGDRTSDILCARQAGLLSILTDTGAGGRDGACAVEPDFRAADLAEAADLILRLDAGA
ncbi:MAG: HAD-IIIA family hydrolase [Desulfovibrio sp.]|jgi:histidinol-phosphate phosphatase family protein|nr:HAD-IIIA family hydrolase [Desulfovibrio sp.]